MHVYVFMNIITAYFGLLFIYFFIQLYSMYIFCMYHEVLQTFIFLCNPVFHMAGWINYVDTLLNSWLVQHCCVYITSHLFLYFVCVHFILWIMFLIYFAFLFQVWGNVLRRSLQFLDLSSHVFHWCYQF